MSNKTTEFFVDKIGDKLFIEIEVTKDPNIVVDALMKSLHTDEDIFEGAKVTQILFKGRNTDTIMKEMKEKIVKGIIETLQGIDV